MNRCQRTELCQLTFLVVVLAFSMAAPAAIASPMYDVTDLGTLPGGSAYYASGINASGQIVGRWSTAASGQVNGSFLYSNGQMIDTTATGANGYGINDSGQMTQGTDRAINNSGETIGGEGGGYVDSNGSKVSLPYGFSPVAINDSGTIVGVLEGIDPSGKPGPQAALYSNGKVTVFGQNPSEGLAINNTGQIAGDTGSSGNAFYFDGSKTHSLGNIGNLAAGMSIATGINDLGEIVGYSSFGVGTYGYTLNSHAFLSVGGNGMLDLNSLIPQGSGWVLNYATAINDSGVIVGYGEYDGDTYRAFELTPIAESVPEPTTLAFVGVYMGYAALSRLVRRVKR